MCFAWNFYPVCTEELITKLIEKFEPGIIHDQSTAKEEFNPFVADYNIFKPRFGFSIGFSVYMH